MNTVLLFTVCYHGDMWKECETLHKMVLPDLRAWCENKKIQLIDHDIRWGGPLLKENLVANKQLMEEAYYNGEMPFFINLTCESLGLIPMWGDAPDDMTAEIHKRLHLTTDHLDLLYGAYREDNPNAIVLLRNDQFLDDLGPEERRYFVKKHLLSSSQRQTCARCLNKYPEDRVFRYSYETIHVEQETKQIQLDINKAVFQKVVRYIKQRIEDECRGVIDDCDVTDQLCYSQESVVKQLSLKVRDSDLVLKQLEEYIQTGGKDVPLLLLGEAGTGKSSVMAKAVHEFSKPGYLDKYLPASSKEGWLLSYFFVGATPGSTELQVMLRKLLKQLNLSGVSSLPQDIDALSQMCCTALSGGTDCHLVLIVDAVNQFDDELASQIVSWVPRKLAPNIRCILSMEDGSIQHKKLMSRESKAQELYMTPLHFDARKQIVTEILSQYNRWLTRDQMNWLLAKQGSENPLWLSLAAEELCITQDCYLFDQYIKDMPGVLQDLLEKILDRLEHLHGNLLVACLCLLEVSVSGLLESELRMLLGKVHQQVIPSPFEEKEEKESSEKDLGKLQNGLKPLDEQHWLEIHAALRPYLRPFGTSKDSRLHYYHRAFGKAVRTRYFNVGRENESCNDLQVSYKHWHHELADYFEQCTDIDRKVEEYLYHLCQIEDTYRLCQALCDWSILDKLYNEEYSSQLLNYWRMAGGGDQMVSCYTEALAELEAVQPRDEELIAARFELIARIYLQAGKYTESLDLSKSVMKWEEKELGNRPERMVELNSLMAEIYEEKLKLNDFVSHTQLPDLRKTIKYARRSIEIRKGLAGDSHKLKLAMSLMKLAFSLESWSACGGNEMEMTGEEAIREGNEHIDQAICIFKELKDVGHYAEALMTKGVLANRGSMEQLKYYNEAMELCHQVYGEESLLSSRLYINIGIVYEDNNDYVKAYKYFKKWAETSETVLGPDHPKTIRAKGVLREPQYRLVAMRLKQLYEANNSDNHVDNASIDEARINQEVGNLDEEEDSYRNHEERIEQHENDNIRHLINATNIMQGIFNDIWHHLNSDDDHQDDDNNDDDDVDRDENRVNMPQEAVINQDSPNHQVIVSNREVSSDITAVMDNENSNSSSMPDSNVVNQNNTSDNPFDFEPFEAVIAQFLESSSIIGQRELQIDSNRISDESNNSEPTSSHDTTQTDDNSDENNLPGPDHDNDDLILVSGNTNRTVAVMDVGVNTAVDDTVVDHNLHHENRNV